MRLLWPICTAKSCSSPARAGAVGSAVTTAVKAAGGTAIATDLAAEVSTRRSTSPPRPTGSAVAADIEQTHGRLDGLVNAAGIVALGSVEQLDFATWRRVLSVNLDGAFLGCKYAMPLLRKKGGAIVNLSSVSGLVGGHNLAAYNASKGGVSLLSKSVALLWRAVQSAGALQCRLPGLPRRTDGGLHRGVGARSRNGAAENDRRNSASAASASRRRSPTCASICCRSRPPSSPARTCRSMAG